MYIRMDERIINVNEVEDIYIDDELDLIITYRSGRHVRLIYGCRDVAMFHLNQIWEHMKEANKDPYEDIVKRTLKQQLLRESERNL